LSVAEPVLLGIARGARRAAPGRGAAAGLVVALVVLGAAGVARAQSLRPNILIVFDTSGSMLHNDTDDGSSLCMGNGQTSRIFSLKKAIRDSLAQVGTDEANFGLMRYPELENPGTTAVCPQGQYGNDATTALPVGCTGTCSDTCECGCRLTTHTTQTVYNDGSSPNWFDSAFRSALVVDVTKRPTLPALKPAASDFDPADGNIAEVYRWTDNTEDLTGGATISDPELRTHANWYTPIGRSLFYARMYFDNFVKPADPKGACRTNIVIFVTDGDETCDTKKNANATLDLGTCAATGYGTFQPEVQACQLNVTSGVKTYVLTDVSTSAENDAIAKAGGTGAAIRVTLTNTAAVRAALVGIIAATVPPTEICNGKDDNCNGLIDEGVSNMCPVSNNPNDPDNLKGVNAQHCAVETCNCKDDNCNGVVDEGLPVNACGGPCGCAVPKEICDGLDNNCDGNIDEGFNVGAACVNGGVGACKRGGLLACNAAGTGTFCDAPVVPPTTEICNNIDDDCNGKVDDGPLPGVGVACGNSLGACQAGVTACVNGQLVCNTASAPKPEVCNGLDDDCDGVIDNGNFPMVGMDCVCPGLDPAKVGVGECKGGKYACEGKLGIVCEGCVFPRPEICDGKDNDCDGVADTNATCPSSFGCRAGACTLLCKGGEFQCPSGYKCEADYCVPARCVTVTCASGQRCDESSGLCVDVCAGVVCAAPATCVSGSCVDCETLGCDPGQVCYEGACRANKCAGVTCPDTEACDDGQCVGLCPPGKCGGGQKCVNGQCLADKCATVGCGRQQFCDPNDGLCKSDPCQSMQCQQGQRCVSTTGTCAPDPCRLMQCPTDCWTCGTTADGTGICVDNGQCTQSKTKVGQKGGGCTCALDDDAGRPGAPWALLLVGLAAVARRRRRDTSRK
jgi:MYXO-CTERM domain-containing protein